MNKILLIDDAVITLNILTDILEHNNFQVVATAEDGQEGFEKYKETKPDLTIIDITMPKVDGLKGIEMIREFDNNARIIVCSALGQKQTVLKALKAGAIDYILKPFEESKIINCIKKHLNAF